MNIIEMAFRMAAAVEQYAARARQFYYLVVLSGHACPSCGGALAMVAEGTCRCISCGGSFDPTTTFQRCPSCGGKLRLSVRRYTCRGCGSDIASQFLFDGLVFDAEYFRQKVAESRQRKIELRDRVRQILAESRSNALQLEALEPENMCGLYQALDSLTLEAFAGALPRSRSRFDLRRYQAHIQAHLRPMPLSMEQIPPLSENDRHDRVWRFIAVIFLAHAGIIAVRQEGDTILVIKHETNREGQDVPGDLEEADGVEGPMGRATA